MNCLSDILRRRRRSHFYVPSDEKVEVGFSEVVFPLSDDAGGRLEGRLSLLGQSIYCMRVVIGLPGSSSLLLGALLDELPGADDVSVIVEGGHLRLSRVHGAVSMVVVMDYRPWRISLYLDGRLSVSVDSVRLLAPSNPGNNNDSVVAISMVTNVHGGQHRLHGLPERGCVTSRLQRGHQYRMYNTDEFGLAVGTDRPLYGSVPLVLAHCAHSAVGLLARGPSRTTVLRVGRGGSLHWTIEGGVADLLSLPAKDALSVRRALLTLTAAATPLPPLFALGYHQCRWNYEDQQDLLEVDGRLRDAGIPCDAVWLDIEHTDGRRYFTWDRDKFDPSALIEHLRSHNRHLVVIIDPHLKEDPAYHIYREALEGGHLVRDEEGLALVGECWPGKSSWVDFISEEASSWWSDKIRLYLQEFGCSKVSNNLWVWNDMNEPAVFQCPDNQMRPTARHAGALEHREVHNIYGQRMARASWLGILKASENNLRPFLLSRSFFTGSQRYGAVWTGDSLSCWEHLRVSVPMMLSLAICGIDFCGADVGGFHGDPDPELLCRWYQLGAFQPFFRAHAHIESRRREPYLVEEPYQKAIKSAVCLRYKLLSYWYSCFWQAETNLQPVVTPLWMAFPHHDKKCYDDESYMIGTDLLVRPIVSPLCRSISLTLPGTIKDLWYRYCNVSGVWKVHHAGRRLTIPVDLESIPVFYRGGCGIFTKEGSFNNTEEWQKAPYDIVLFPGALGTCSGVLYVDDGRTFDYRHGGRYGLYRCSFEVVKGLVSMKTVHRDEGVGNPDVARITIINGGSIGACERVSVCHGTSSEQGLIEWCDDRVELGGMHLTASEDWTVTIE